MRRLLSFLSIIALSLVLAACAKKTNAPVNTTAAPVTTTAKPNTTTTKEATQAPQTTTAAPQTTTAAPQTTTAAPATTTQTQSVTYTVTLEEALPEGRTILVWAWNGSGSVGCFPEINGTTLTFTADSAIDGAIIVVLKEGQTTLGEEWVNKDYQSPDLTFTNNAATWNNHVVEVNIDYTITLSYAIEGRTLLVYAWSDSVAGQLLTPTVNGTTLTFSAKAEFTKALVVVLKEGQTEIGEEWANKDYQSEDLTFTDHAATYENNAPITPAEDITYTITLAYEITGRTVLIYAWNSDGGSPMINPTVNATTLTFTSKVEYTQCIVVVLKEGQTEVGTDWVNKEYQSPDLTFTNHACTYANEAPITYTITCDTEITRTVYLWLWDDNQDTPQYCVKATVDGKTITAVGYREYTIATVRVLNEGDTEVNSSWTNINYESPVINLTNHEGTYNNAEVTTITYTITLNGTIPENRTVVVWGWASGLSSEFAATIEGNTLTFETSAELDGCLIVLLKEGVTTLNGDWNNNKDKQTNDLTIDKTTHTITWDGTWK